MPIALIMHTVGSFTTHMYPMISPSSITVIYRLPFPSRFQHRNPSQLCSTSTCSHKFRHQLLTVVHSTIVGACAHACITSAYFIHLLRKRLTHPHPHANSRFVCFHPLLKVCIPLLPDFTGRELTSMLHSLTWMGQALPDTMAAALWPSLTATIADIAPHSGLTSTLLRALVDLQLSPPRPFLKALVARTMPSLQRHFDGAGLFKTLRVRSCVGGCVSGRGVCVGAGVSGCSCRCGAGVDVCVRAVQVWVGVCVRG